MSADDDIAPSDIEAGSMVWDLAFHPKNDILALGCIDGVVQVYGYKPEETDLLFSMKNHKDGVRSMEFTNSGSHLWTASSDGSLKSVECETRNVVFDQRDTGHPDALNVLHFLDEHLLVTGCDGGVVQLWDTRQHTPAMHWTDLLGTGIMSFTHHHSKGQILAGSDDGAIAVFEMRKAEAEVLTAANDDAVTSLGLIGGPIGSGDGTHVAAGCNSGNVRIWKYGVWNKCVDNLKGHPCEVEGVMQLKDGDVVTASCDGVVRAVRLMPQPKLLDTLGNIEDAASMRLAKSRCGTFMGCAGGESVIFFDIRKYVTGTVSEHPNGHAFLKPSTAEEDAEECEEDEEDEDMDSDDMDEDSDDSDKKDEQDPKERHKKGKHNVDFKRQGRQQQQKKFFDGL